MYERQVILLRRLFNCMIPALVIAVLMATAPFYDACRELTEDVLRVHIVANSDSAADQSLKLAVRDRIVSACASYYTDCGSREEAREITRAHLSDFERIAGDEVRAHGFDYPVTAEMDEMYFETRYYEDFTMPAGWYEALRLNIGDAAGRNWWCVIYPTLCIGAACRDTAEQKLDGGERSVIRADKADFRFKLVELFESFLNWFR